MVVAANPSLASLAPYAAKKRWSAEDGSPGAGGRKEGRRGADAVLEVPVGTQVLDAGTGEVIGDLGRDGDQLVVARGGAGGRGNVKFATPTRRTPRLAEPGLPGDSRILQLELKLIADAGLVGPPNAGKSSLLAALTAAHPKVADYPFTTLGPELGVAISGDGRRLVMADIPGLVEGASRGTGLGLRFLRHLERTRALVMVLDGSGPSPWDDLRVIRSEIEAYSRDLARRPSVVAVNKVDLEPARRLRARTRRRGVHFVSALTGEGLVELLEGIWAAVGAAPPAPTASLPFAPRRLRPAAAPPPTVSRRSWGYEVLGPRIERLVARTEFDSEESLARFQVVLDRWGVTAQLEAAGARAGDTVRAGGVEFEYQP